MENELFPYDEEGKWFKNAPVVDRMAHYDHRLRVVSALNDALDCFGDTELDYGLTLPVDQWLKIEIPYLIPHELPDAAERFRILSERVERMGGTVIARPAFDKLEQCDTVQHIAELPFGNGAVLYRVTWIERLPKTDDNDKEKEGNKE